MSQSLSEDIVKQLNVGKLCPTECVIRNAALCCILKMTGPEALCYRMPDRVRLSRAAFYRMVI